MSAQIFRLKKHGKRGFAITDPNGRLHYRHYLETPDDAFVLVECDAGHTYAVDRQVFRWGEPPACPRCVAADRRAA